MRHNSTTPSPVKWGDLSETTGWWMKTADGSTSLSARGATQGKDQNVRDTSSEVWRDMIKITVPGVPPSVNNYIRHDRGRHHLSAATIRFNETLSACSRNVGIMRGKEYAVFITVYLGKGQKGDWDNFAKVPCDALVRAKVIDTDAKIKYGSVSVRRDNDKPRTEIKIYLLDNPYVRLNLHGLHTSDDDIPGAESGEPLRRAISDRLGQVPSATGPGILRQREADKGVR